MKDVSQIYLSRKEKLFLFFLRFRKNRKLPKKYYRLYQMNLIDYDSLPEQDAFGAYLKSELIHLTQFYWDWVYYRRERRLDKIWIPIAVSMITSLLTTLITLWLSG